MTKKETRSVRAAALRKGAEEKARKKGGRMEGKIEAMTSEETQHLLHELRVHQIELEMQNEELRSSQEELGASQARYFDLYDLAPVGYFVLNEQGLILEGNLTVATLLGVARGALVKQPFNSFIFPEDQDIYYRHRRQLFETGARQICVMRMLGKDRAPFWARVETAAARDAGGAPVCRAVLSDITELKRTEEALRESEARYRALFEYSADGILLADQETKIFKYANPAICRMLGYTQDELKTLGISNIHPKDDLPHVAAEFEAQARGEKTLATDLPCLRKDGTIFLAEVNATLVIIDGRRCLLGFFRDITKRKRAEERMEHLNRLLRTIHDVNLLLSREKDPDRLSQHVCEILKKMRGYYNVWIALFDGAGGLLGTAEAGLGKHFLPIAEQLKGGELTGCARRAFSQYEVVVTLDPSSTCADCPLAAHYAGRGALTVQLQYGEKAYGLLAVSIPVHLAADEEEQTLLQELAGDIALALHAIEQEKERRRVERKLRESEEKHQSLVRAVVDPIIMANAREEVLLLNTAAAVLFDKPEGEILNQNIAKLMPEKEARVWRDTMEKVIASGTPNVLTHWLNQRYFESVFSPVTDPKGRVFAVTIVARDLTDRKFDEEKIEKLARFPSENPNPVLRVSKEGVILYCNTAGKLLLKNWRCRMGEALPEEWRIKVAEVFRTGKITDVKFECDDKNFSLTFAPVSDSGYINIYGLDITARKKAEKELRESEEWFRSVYDNAKDGIIISEASLERAPVIIDVNTAACEMNGYAREELIGQSLKLLDKNLKSSPDIEKRLATGEALIFETTHTRKDGSTFPVEVSLKNIQIGGRAYVVAIERDITNRKKTEDSLRQSENQLRQAQKMEAIGRLAGGIAHDFNNLLTAITGFSDLTLDQLPEGSPLRDDIETIKKAAFRAAALTRQLLAFSHQQALQPQILNLNETISNLDKMLRRIIGEDIQIVARLAEKIPRIKADPGQIEQVIMNLTINARDAMPNGGVITIATENVSIDEATAAVIPGSYPGRFVLLSLEDTGTGIDPQTIEHIFEPFFTTKKVAEGTGLGLSTVYGIVKQHGGWINAYSEPGRGSVFKMYFPAFEVGTGWEIEEAVSPEPPRGEGEKILVVEDEEGVRNFISRALRQYGYVVFAAESVAEGEKIFNEQPGDIDLLFTDVLLTDGSGLRLAQQLRGRQPDLAILLCSGYSDGHFSWTAEDRKIFRLLQKPCSLYDLLSTVKKVLRERAEKAPGNVAGKK